MIRPPGIKTKGWYHYRCADSRAIDPTWISYVSRDRESPSRKSQVPESEPPAGGVRAKLLGSDYPRFCSPRITLPPSLYPGRRECITNSRAGSTADCVPYGPVVRPPRLARPWD